MYRMEPTVWVDLEGVHLLHTTTGLQMDLTWSFSILLVQIKTCMKM